MTSHQIKTTKINSSRLAKYQNLFLFAGQVAGRVVLNNTMDSGRVHGTVKSASNAFLKHWLLMVEEVRKTDSALADSLISDNPFCTLLDSLTGERDECMQCIEEAERFFYDVVFDVARVENVKIVYFQLYANDFSHYACCLPEGKKENYPKFLLSKGYSPEELMGMSVKVSPDDYSYSQER